MIGSKLLHYRVTKALGSGGMGEVYLAEDTRLKRSVAIKILPAAVAAQSDRRDRFEREAQTVAALNHPNIVTIHSIEKAPSTSPGQSDTHFISMEYVDGRTLADLLPKDGFPLRRLLTIAIQIADAVAAAHQHGIVHRDLKPANVMVIGQDRVKVLDFGLAKLRDATVDAADGALATRELTGEGQIVGTVAYMSPEQAEGTAVDERSDMFSLGVMLYEMATGERPFKGDTNLSILSSVLRDTPKALTELNPALPREFVRIVRHCLIKDPEHRYQSAKDLRNELEELQQFEIDDVIRPSVSRQTPATSITSDARVARRQRVLPWGVAVIAFLAAIAMLRLWAPWQNAPPLALVRVTTDLGAAVSLVTTQGAAAILSPDGTAVAFVGQASAGGAPPQLYLRRLDQLTSLPLAGTDGAMNPFFSPDGRWIAFFADGKLKKVAAGGGATVTLADTPNARGGSWGDDDTLVFMPDLSGGLWRVSSTGGQAVQLTTLAEGEVSHRWPQVLPGSQTVLYTSHNSLTGYEDAMLVVQRLPTGPRTVVQRGGYYGRYLPSGHLVYMHEGTLFGAPFDLARLERTGEPVPVVQDVAGSAIFTGGAQFATAGNGTALYVPGSNDALPMQWIDDSANTTFLRAMPASWSDPTFSPDGRHLAMDIYDGKQANVWVYEWARDALTRLTFERRGAFKPVWTPDGRRIAFASARDGLVFNLYWQRVDGTGDVQRLTEGPNSQFAASWHPSGKFLAYEELSPQTNFDLMMLPLEGDDASGWKPGKPRAFLNGPAAEIEPMFSPDGRWLAYFSNESGRFEAYVRPFPGPGGQWQISSGGGSWPTWSRTRHELLYSTLDQRIMVAPYSIERDSFRVQPPRRWMEGRHKLRGPVVNRSFDLHPDGNRVVLARTDAQSSNEDKVILVFNFFDELRRVVPAAKR